LAATVRAFVCRDWIRPRKISIRINRSPADITSDTSRYINLLGRVLHAPAIPFSLSQCHHSVADIIAFWYLLKFMSSKKPTWLPYNSEIQRPVSGIQCKVMKCRTVKDLVEHATVITVFFYARVWWHV
jgi:hypothetical protein